MFFSIDVLILGVEGLSGGVPSTSGLSAAMKAAIYIGVAAAVIDIVAGALLMVSLILLFSGYLNNMF